MSQTDTGRGPEVRPTLWEFRSVREALAALDGAIRISEWPVTPDHGPASREFAECIVQKAWRASGGVRSVALWMIRKWNQNCWRRWSDEELSGSLAGAVKKGIPWRERRAFEDARWDRAEKIKEVAKRLGVGERQAQKLVSSGATHPEAAKAIAEVMGEDVSYFLRTWARRGRPVDVKASFTKWNFGVGGFPAFQREHPATISRFGVVESYDGLMANARLRGILEAEAESVWNEFLRWKYLLLGTLIFPADGGLAALRLILPQVGEPNSRLK